MGKNRERTVTEAFVEAKKRPVTQVAFRYSDGSNWHDISWPEYFKMSERVGSGLAALGVKRGDRVAIMSHTRYHWAVSDMAILGIGCVTVPIYQSSTPEDVEFILNNSEAVAVFVEDQGQWEKLKGLRSRTPSVKSVVSYNLINDSDVVSWDGLQKKGDEYLAKNAGFFESECHKNTLDQMATIVYTSGTTGVPKGVVLLHQCIASECEDLCKVLDISEKDSTLTFLPFAHIFGRVELWTNVYVGWTVAFAESIDKIAANMPVIKPTLMIAVPRIFEKIYARIISQAEDGSPLKKKIFRWAVEVGSQVSRLKRSHGEIPLGLALQYKLAYKLVFSKLNAKLGGRIRFFVSGGAPLSKEIAEFFHAAGLLVLEGYGLTETTAGITVNTPYKYGFGVVGTPIGDVQIKIAEDGEVLAKSKKVFREYFRNPEATAESLHDGWFYTGDIGEITSEGFLRITDRKKDLIKTAGGKMIAPQKIENLLKTNKFISQAAVFGDKMKYLVVLVTLNSDEVKRYALEHGLDPADPNLLYKNPKIRELVSDIVREKNNILASYETVKNFAILPKELTVEDGELTPSLKVKRKYLGSKYETMIRELYTS